MNADEFTAAVLAEVVPTALVAGMLLGILVAVAFIGGYRVTWALHDFIVARRAARKVAARAAG